MHKIYRFNEDREGFGNKLKELMVANGYTIESLSFDLDEMLIFDIDPKITEVSPDKINQLFIQKCQQCKQICDFANKDLEITINAKTQVLQDPQVHF